MWIILVLYWIVRLSLSLFVPALKRADAPVPDAIPVSGFMSTGDAAIRMFDTNVILASSFTPAVSTLSSLAAVSLTQITVPQQLVLPGEKADGSSRIILPAVTKKATSNRDKGKIPPSACELYGAHPQSALQYYQTEGDFVNTCFFLVKDGWLSRSELLLVSAACPDIKDMIESVPHLLQVDFSSLRDPVPDYAAQTTIDPHRVELMTACAVHYNLNIGLVVRYLGGEYTASWRSVQDILNASAPYVSDAVLSHLLTRVLTVGCPAGFNWNEPSNNKQRFIKRGNLPALDVHKSVAEKALTKEVRNSHLIPFASWVCVCSAHSRHTPQNIQIKPGKKPRLIWDGTSRKYWHESTMNMMTPMDSELEVSFGTAFTNLCIWIWNLRITHPDDDILLAFIDISSCFRFPRIAADLAGAFGFIVDACFFAANAGVFGSVCSASSWEPLRLAIAAIGLACFFRLDLIQKYAELLALIRFDDEPPVTTNIVQATRCSINRGVIDDSGGRLPTPHNIYVDDNLLAEVRPLMPQALASAFEGVFSVMGYPSPSLRPIAVAIDKLMELYVSYLQVLLGLEVDTRAMTVSITNQYRNEVLVILQSTWHKDRRTFTVKEMELLVGKLGRIAQAFRPLYYLMPHLYSSLAYALQQNKAHLVTTSRRFRELLQTSKQSLLLLEKGSMDRRRVTFAASKTAKAVHGCRGQYRIPSSLAAEIDFLRTIMADPTISLSTPIGHLIPRDYSFTMFADSCKYSGGGWSTDFGCWWYLEYPPEVIRRAMLKNNKHGDYISINSLEMLCVIVNYAAALHFCWLDGIDISHAPLIRNWCDNTSACSWINTRCKDSLVGGALGRFFCGLLMGSALGLCTDWLSTHENTIADAISRYKRSSEGGIYDFSMLLTDHPTLRSCRQFQPSEHLLSMLWEILLNNGSPDVMMLRQLRPETLGSIIF